jgi:hypothetical protein
MDEEFDFTQLNKEMERSFSERGAYDIKEQAERALRETTLDAVTCLANIVRNSPNESNQLKAATFIIEKVVGNKPIEDKSLDRLLIKLSENDTT